MSVTINKPISKVKELFLAICLLSGEISFETIRLMKMDYGESYLKNNVIQSLKEDGYIKRVNRKKGGYGYQLTVDGLEYMKIKLPNKYDYASYCNSNAYKYDDNIRYRNWTMSLVLYYLARSNIHLSNNVEKVSGILRGESVKIEQPFFITVKEMRRLNVRLFPVYGYRIFGWIVTSDSFWAVYLTDPEHPICLGREKHIHLAMKNFLSYTKHDYSEPKNYRFLFLFKSENDYIESFIGYRGIDTKHNFTSSVYIEYKLKYFGACIINRGYDKLQCIIDSDYSKKIDDTFIVTFELAFYGISYSYQQFRYLYNNKTRTAICWNLSPAVIIEALSFCKYDLEDDEEIIILCFDADFDLLDRLIKRWNMEGKVNVALITKENVKKYISIQTQKHIN